jgi:hypothetical protein
MMTELDHAEIDTLIGYVGELLATDSNEILQSIYNKLTKED